MFTYHIIVFWLFYLLTLPGNEIDFQPYIELILEFPDVEYEKPDDAEFPPGEWGFSFSHITFWIIFTVWTIIFTQ